MRTRTATKRMEQGRGFKAGECLTPDFPNDNPGCERQSADEFFKTLSDVARYIRGELCLIQPDKSVAKWLIVVND